ncbi:MAG: hypothetical protein GF418_17255 [Chitinivibrionales bacterium]|nr:hypothetical protein [Chitinivibrionales bacterium]MBD3397368.1 hypothetical protein [Chitinivibrionales bacterium]
MHASVAVRSLSILIASCVSLSAAPLLRVVLKDSTVIEGARDSENFNFLVVDVNGSKLSLLKTKIDTVIETAAPVEAKQDARADSAGHKTADQETTEVPPATVQPNAPPKPPAVKPKPVPVRKASYEELLEKADTLTVLDLSYRDMKYLPESITRFKALRHLDLKGNALAELPCEIGDLTRLVSLDLRLNRLSSLPPHMCNLMGMRTLFISGNRLDRDAVFHLQRALPDTRIVLSNTPAVRHRDRKPRAFSPEEFRTLDSLCRACTGGSPVACLEQGIMCVKHRDYERAIIAYQHGCPMSAPDTSTASINCCENAARLKESVFGDRGRARTYRQHICKLAPEKSKTPCD